MLNRPWQECWRRFAEAPAHFVGLRNELAEDNKRPLCLITVGEDDRLIEVQTLLPGTH
jgi:hypothetical protein